MTCLAGHDSAGEGRVETAPWLQARAAGRLKMEFTEAGKREEGGGNQISLGQEETEILGGW